MKRYLLLFLLTAFVSNTFAHSDIGVSKTYGRVHSFFTTGFAFEERQKGKIIAQLVNMLSEEMNNKDTIILEMNHKYISRNMKSDYYVGYVLNENKNVTLNISAFSFRFDVKEILKLAEYAINNKNKAMKIAKIEKGRTYQINHPSISEELIDKIVHMPDSKIIDKVLSNRIERPIKDGNVTYYFQNNKYNVVYKKDSGEEKELISLDNIFQISVTGGSLRTILFDTDSSFYYIGGMMPDEIALSKRHIFNRKESYGTYFINFLGRDFISITLNMPKEKSIKRTKHGINTIKHWFGGREGFMIYAADDDMLVEGVDDIIDEINIDIMKKMGYYNKPKITVESSSF